MLFPPGNEVKLNREFLLTAACCRWPPSPERDGAVRAAAADGIDWPRFLATVRRQRVEGLASDALARAGIDLPDGIASELQREAAQIARQNLAFAAESLRLLRLFERAGLALLFVKGATLDMMAYGSLGLKKGRDIDLVIDPEAVEAACALVAQAGYVRTVPGPEVTPEQFPTWVKLCKETNWRHARSGIIIELHNGLVDNPALLPDVGARSPSQWVEIGSGIRLPTLRKDELFAYLCVHGATHAWARMKWIADVAALLKDARFDEIERLYRSSVRLGVGRCSAQALLLCERLFQFSLPPALASELRADAATGRLVRLALGTMGGFHGETELDDTVLGTVPIHLSHLLLAPGWRYKVGELRRKGLSRHDRARIPLPRPLHFLYPLLLVPSWLWRRVKGPAPF